LIAPLHPRPERRGITRCRVNAISYDFSVPVFFEGKVHSVFENAVNITASDQLISIVHKKFFNGPNRIVLDDFSFSLFQNCEIVKFEQDKLFFSNGITINIKNSKRWNSPVKKICIEKLDTSAVSYYLKNHSFIKSSLIEKFKFAVKSQNKELFNYNVEQVLGLGFGLTPSGDDFLVGFLSASHFFDALIPFDFLLKNIKIDYTKTNFISAEYLRYSYEGRISELVANTIFSVSEKKASADFWLKNLISTGATSGYDTLLGILTAMEVYNACKSC